MAIVTTRLDQAIMVNMAKNGHNDHYGLVQYGCLIITLVTHMQIAKFCSEKVVILDHPSNYVLIWLQGEKKCQKFMFLVPAAKRYKYWSIPEAPPPSPELSSCYS